MQEKNFKIDLTKGMGYGNMDSKQQESRKMEYRSGYVGDKKIIGYNTIEKERETLECKTRGEGCYLPGYFKYQEDDQGRRYRTKFHVVPAHTVSIPILEESEPKV
tara:strand:- start:2127 stop:2441 length:315 start_codon:yes stop_codon:yes gene_type:complete